MDDTNIRKYAGLMRELGLTALEVQEAGKNVRLEMDARAPQGATAQVAPQSEIAPAPAPATIDPDVIDVRSPMVGVFYTSPAENADPYVKLGDKVQKGDVLCIIEAMKLMNEITSDHTGTIVEVCAGNNQVVDFGHVIMRIRVES
ncbi:MAG: acetyl-CoA carboxylase biotin carboxyl carrier protein [Christensenellales bacterium]|jgi:acetyl-CoA carboxylase biotin carboxyl carrier protein